MKKTLFYLIGVIFLAGAVASCNNAAEDLSDQLDSLTVSLDSAINELDSITVDIVEVDSMVTDEAKDVE